MASPPLINCPRCGKSTVYSKANAFRPFCSERCKMVDLGAWANEEYRVPGPSADELVDNPAEPKHGK